MPNDLVPTIIENAQGPAKVTGDEGSVEQFPLTEKIAADRYAKSQDAVATSPRLGMRFAKLIPPGSV